MDLINNIKNKKELSGLDNYIVEKALNKVVRGNDFNLENLRKKEIKEIVKLTRKELRLLSGSFRKHSRHGMVNLTDIAGLLSLHSSTRERLSFYTELKNRVNNLNIKSILDLGCGLNPIALADKSVVYYASDINNADLDLVKSFFSENKVKGKTFIFDLRDIWDKHKELPSADLCILFKVMDVIEKKGHKLAEKVIQLINAKYFLVSFSTKTLSGRPMNHPQRGWIERMLDRLGYPYEMFKSKNEIFYLVKKLP